MKRYSKDKDINNLVRLLVSSGWNYKNRKKHGVILAPTGKKITVPSTLSDYRAYKNFSHDVRVIQQG